jgi:hypothetical protein
MNCTVFKQEEIMVNFIKGRGKNVSAHAKKAYGRAEL